MQKDSTIELQEKRGHILIENYPFFTSEDSEGLVKLDRFNDSFKNPWQVVPRY